MKGELITTSPAGVPALKDDERPPAIVVAAGRPAQNAWRDFFKQVKLRNANTYRSYEHKVRRFLEYCEVLERDLANIMPGDVAEYLENNVGGAVSSQKVHRSALSKYFDLLVTRHVCLINPVASVKTPKLVRSSGTTELIENDEIAQILATINDSKLSGLRDRTIFSVLAGTACRANGVAHLRRGHYRGRPGRMKLVFNEKGGNEIKIAVRSDLEELLDHYLTVARMKTADKACPLFRPMLRREQQFRPWVPENKAAGINEEGCLSPNDVCRMVKRRIRAAELREDVSAHSMRVAVLTNLLEQGIPVDEVQKLAGHKDPRTTKLYDRSKREVTQNLVERIDVGAFASTVSSESEDEAA